MASQPCGGTGRLQTLEIPSYARGFCSVFGRVHKQTVHMEVYGGQKMETKQKEARCLTTSSHITGSI